MSTTSTREPPGEGPGPDPGRLTAPPRRRRWWLLLAVPVVAVIALAIARGWDEYRADRARREADEALARRDLAAAAASLDRYVELRPRDPAGWFLAARTARRLGRFDDAARFLGRCQDEGGVTDATRLEWHLFHVQQGHLGEADAHLRATVGPDHPDAPLVLEALARGYIAADRFLDARQACEMWQKLEPDHPQPWLWSGWIAERLIQLEKAATDYRRAVEVAPGDRDARVAYARVLVRQRQPAAAAEHYEWVLARAPDDAEALTGLAGCRIEQGRAGEAVPLLDRALAREPDSFTGLFLRGRAAMEQGDPAAAEDWLRRATRAEPHDTEALHQLVQCLRALRKDAEADPLARRLKELQDGLGRLTELRRTLAAQPDDAAPAHEAGVIALRVGRTQEGLNLLREALRRKGDHRPTHAVLADHYRRAGEPALADYHQRLAGQP